jgi:hypothetical protein
LENIWGVQKYLDIIIITIIILIDHHNHMLSLLGLVPDKPRNLTVANITSSSAVISWLDPLDERTYSYFSRFLIKLKKENTLILSIPTGRVNEYQLNNLTPYTTYEISVASGNHYGFGEESVASFLTSEEGGCEIQLV